MQEAGKKVMLHTANGVAQIRLQKQQSLKNHCPFEHMKLSNVHGKGYNEHRIYGCAKIQGQWCYK